MGVTLTIDKAGRVVIPKPIRDALHLKPGSALEVERQEDSIVLRLPRAGAVMKQKNGFWVFDSGGRITTGMVDETVAEVRKERDERTVSD